MSQYPHRPRFEFFLAAQYFLQANRLGGAYFEFGIHEVNTFRMALNTLGRHDIPTPVSKFYAFDSFQGMPEPNGLDRQEIWRKGMNMTSEETFLKKVRRDRYRVVPVAGFYEDSLRRAARSIDEPLAVAYIDCDYYSSTVEVLAFLEARLRHGSIICFDDWDCYYADPARGQRKAFSELEHRVGYRIGFEPFIRLTTGGMSFVCHEKSKLGAAIL